MKNEKQALILHGRLDLERAIVIAESFKAEGDILTDQNRLAENLQSYLQALSFFLETGMSDQIVPSPLRLAQQVEWLVSQAAIMSLPDNIHIGMAYRWGEPK
jgi:hypothetical protein